LVGSLGWASQSVADTVGKGWGWKIKKKLIGLDFLGSPPLHLSVLIVWTDDLLLGLSARPMFHAVLVLVEGFGSAGHVFRFNKKTDGTCLYFLALLPFPVCVLSGGSILPPGLITAIDIPKRVLFFSFFLLS
jgi:hypothetical protein